MGFFGGPKMSAVPPPPIPASVASASAQQSGAQLAAAAAAAEGQGFGNTLETSPEGAKPPALAKQTLGG